MTQLIVTQLMIVALATWQAVEIWNHSALFAERRARAEANTNFISRLLTCPFCLSVWVAFVLSICTTFIVPVAAYACSNTLRSQISELPLWTFTPLMIDLACYLVVVTLAASRLANAANDFMWDYTRTPKEDQPVVEATNETDTENNQDEDVPEAGNAR